MSRGDYYNAEIDRLIREGPESPLVTTNNYPLGWVIWTDEGPFTIAHRGVQFTDDDGQRWHEYFLKKGKLK